jgi:mono/diheme cytochrome c family protein
VSRNDLILGAFALALVVFSVVVSMVIPRRRPDFPGNRLGLFVAISVLLVVAMLAAVEVFGAEEGHEAAAEEEVATNVQDSGEPDTETGGSPVTTGQTPTGETETGDGEPGGDVARGEEVFASAGCGNCHVLEAAGAQGTIGPNLDDVRPGLEATVEQVTNGGNGMPAFGDQLSQEDIQAVAAFVVQSTQR